MQQRAVQMCVVDGGYIYIDIYPDMLWRNSRKLFPTQNLNFICFLDASEAINAGVVAGMSHGGSVKDQLREGGSTVVTDWIKCGDVGTFHCLVEDAVDYRQVEKQGRLLPVSKPLPVGIAEVMGTALDGEGLATEGSDFDHSWPRDGLHWRENTLSNFLLMV